MSHIVVYPCALWSPRMKERDTTSEAHEVDELGNEDAETAVTEPSCVWCSKFPWMLTGCKSRVDNLLLLLL